MCLPRKARGEQKPGSNQSYTELQSSRVPRCIGATKRISQTIEIPHACARDERAHEAWLETTSDTPPLRRGVAKAII